MSKTTWDSDLQRGVEDFNTHRWWHAHEAWEQVWKELSDRRVRAGLQALIQVCGILYHLERGNLRPARNLGRRACELLDESGDASIPVAIEGVRAWLEDFCKAASSNSELSAVQWIERGKSLQASVS